MQRTTIESIVNSIDSALGPEADAAQVENLAIKVLSSMRTGETVQSENDTSPGTVDAREVAIHVRVDDCGSRLAPTVIAHCYDKIRRLTSGLPSASKDFFGAEHVHVPVVSLHVHGAANLMKDFSASDVVEIASAVEQAAVDCGFDRIELLHLKAGKSETVASLLSSIPDILGACPKSAVSVELGSSAVGIRAQELLDTAEMLLHSHRLNDEYPRITCTANAAPDFWLFRHYPGAVRIDLHVSVWPLLEMARQKLPIDACYGDRHTVLASVGQQAWRQSQGALNRMMATLQTDSDQVGSGGISLSIDAPGEGPLAAGIWAGIPIDMVADGSASRAAASLLKSGLLSGATSSPDVSIISDARPLTYSLRNVHAVDSGMAPAELAGYLIEAFTCPVRDNQPRWLQIVPVASATEQDGIRLGGVAGIVPFVERNTGWQNEHFTRGGALIPPRGEQRW